MPSAATANVINQHTFFPFLSLPAEVQNNIYRYVFVKDGSYIGASKNGNSTKTETFLEEIRQYRNVNFLLTCRQINHQAPLEFYTKNGFEFFNMAMLVEFLQVIGIKYRKMLTKIRFHYSLPACTEYVAEPGWRAFRGLRWLISCTNLKTLEINGRYVPSGVKHCWWSFPIENAWQVFFGTSTEICIGEAIARGDTFNLYSVQETVPDQRRRILCDALKYALNDIILQRRRCKGEASYIHSWKYLPWIFEGDPRPWKKTGKRANKAALQATPSRRGDYLSEESVLRPPKTSGNIYQLADPIEESMIDEANLSTNHDSTINNDAYNSLLDNKITNYSHITHTSIHQLISRQHYVDRSAEIYYHIRQDGSLQVCDTSCNSSTSQCVGCLKGSQALTFWENNAASEVSRNTNHQLYGTNHPKDGFTSPDDGKGTEQAAFSTFEDEMVDYEAYALSQNNSCVALQDNRGTNTMTPPSPEKGTHHSNSPPDEDLRNRIYPAFIPPPPCSTPTQYYNHINDTNHDDDTLQAYLENLHDTDINIRLAHLTEPGPLTVTRGPKTRTARFRSQTDAFPVSPVTGPYPLEYLLRALYASQGKGKELRP